jgi:hypothetical protein
LLMILLRPGLFLLFPGVVLPLLFRRIIALLPLLVLLRPGLFFLLPGVVLPLLFRRIVALLPFLTLLSLRLLLVFRFCGLVLLLPFLLSLFLRFRWLGFLLLFLLPRVRGKTHPEQQKKRGCLNDSNPFHGVASVTSTSAPVSRNERRVYC